MHGCHGHHHGWGHSMMAGRGGKGRGFGRGGAFGRHRGSPFGHGGGSRTFDSGALRLVVLGLIEEEPRHGYDIIKALETRFRGTYSPSPGAIYPMLQMLEEADLVASQADGNKRRYSITEAGRAYLDENRAELDRINEQLEEAFGDIQGDSLRDMFRALRHALAGRWRSGELDSGQLAKAVEILRRARDEIERL